MPWIKSLSRFFVFLVGRKQQSVSLSVRNNSMIYTSNIQKAIRFSVKTHEVYQKQKRKGKDIPYITHPLSVGLILARAGASEEVIIAGILHDTIEDSILEKKVTKEMITERFGGEVALLVASVSETDKSLSWEERKKEALTHIGTFSQSSLLVKSADILSNASELLDDYKREGEAVFARFNAPKEKILKHYFAAISAILEKWSESPLAEDLQELSKQLQGLEHPRVKKKYKITFQPLVGDGDSKDYIVEAENEDTAQEIALEKLLLEESDGILLDCPGQIATAEEIK